MTHIERAAVDLRLAERQWEAYVYELAHADWTTIEVAPAPDCADSVFIEDMVVVHGEVAVLTRPGAEVRRPELADAAAAVRSLGLDVASIEAPGLLDGGDALILDGTVYVGVGGRSNEAGAAQLGGALGLRVVAIPIAGVLHLKTAVTALPDGTAVGYPPLVPPAFAALESVRFQAVPEPTGAQVVVLDERRILLAPDCPMSAELYAGLGFEPIVVDIGEFQKLEGCVTCLSVLCP